MLSNEDRLLLDKYDDIFMRAWKEVLDAWVNGKILPDSEADLRCYLFCGCVRLMKSCVQPYAIRAEETLKVKTLKKEKPPRADITFGSIEGSETRILVLEIKWDDGTGKSFVRRVKQDMGKLAAYFEESKGILCYSAIVLEHAHTERYMKEFNLEQFRMAPIEGKSRLIRTEYSEKDALIYGYTST